MKIVILDGYTLNPGDLSWKELEQLGEVVVYDRTSEDEVIERIADADVVFTNKCPLSASAIESSRTLKYIGVLATGYNIVDVEAARNAGIVVSNIPTYGTDAVSQYTIALLLELCHHIGAHWESVKAGGWTDSPDWCYWNYPLIELAGKTMGIIGFGRIGQGTARIALAMGMKILAYDKFPNLSLETKDCRFVSMEELLSGSDVIALHCPLFPETEGLINRDTIAKMKDGVLIINDSRGPLIVEEDLYEALNSGKVGGAALDVVSVEPIQKDNPLLHAKNVIITPHIAWAPKESRMRLMKIAVNNLKAFLDGKSEHVVSGSNT